MQSGAMVEEWPAVLGCDAGGLVLECGDGVTKFKPGDYAYGCTRVGKNQYSTYQETFLMDEDIALKKSSNISIESASTIGVGLEVRVSITSGSSAGLLETGAALLTWRNLRRQPSVSSRGQVKFCGPLVVRPTGRTGG